MEEVRSCAEVSKFRHRVQDPWRETAGGFSFKGRPPVHRRQRYAPATSLIHTLDISRIAKYAWLNHAAAWIIKEKRQRVSLKHRAGAGVTSFSCITDAEKAQWGAWRVMQNLSGRTLKH